MYKKMWLKIDEFFFVWIVGLSDFLEIRFDFTFIDFDVRLFNINSAGKITHYY